MRSTSSRFRDFRSRDQQDKPGHAVQKYRLSTDIEVSLPVAGRQQSGKFMPADTTFLYLSALKVVLFTMSKAGTFIVNRTEARGRDSFRTFAAAP
eukprot:4680724-Amphidinium_carterae.1